MTHKAWTTLFSGPLQKKWVTPGIEWLGNVSEELKLNRYTNDCERVGTSSIELLKPVRREDVGPLAPKADIKSSFPVFHGLFLDLPCALSCYLMSHSLGHWDTHRMRTDSHRHPEALSCNLACAPHLHPPHVQGLTAKNTFNKVGRWWDMSQGWSPSTGSMFTQTSLRKQIQR